MYWCYSCQANCHCPSSCSACHSEAVEQITATNNPKSFTPYVVESQKEEQYFSFESLYRNAYQDLFSTVSERRLQAVRNVSENGTIQVSYVIVVDTSEEDRVRGLTEQEISQLTTKSIQKQCTICQQQSPSSEQGYVLQCQHEFHKQCLNPWIKENGTCPTCRFKLVDQ